jgi:hypothetical protein
MPPEHFHDQANHSIRTSIPHDTDSHAKAEMTMRNDCGNGYGYSSEREHNRTYWVSLFALAK